jgi:hypothetical protein
MVGGSFFRIVPDMLFNSVSLEGTSYDQAGAKAADWESVIARVEKERNKIIVLYLWKGLHTAPEIANVQFHGFGALKFNEPADPGEVITRGGGSFWDVDEAHPEKIVLKPIKLRRVVGEDQVMTMSEGTDSEIEALVKTTLDTWKDF